MELLQAIRNLDVSVYHFLNGFVGNRFLDRFFSYQESNTLLKCGLLVSIYWYFWFCGGPDQERRRKAIFTIIVGTLLALAINRVISAVTPFRIRPMFDQALEHRPFSIQPISDLESWSAFPSDHAAYLCALAFGVAYLSRNLTIPIILYAAGWICLPRLYLGVHYASDIVVGTAIGVATVWAVLQADWLRSSLASHAIAFMDAKPHWFYTIAFLIMFEMGDLFWDIRGPVHLLLHSVSEAGPYHQVFRYGLLLLAALATAMAITFHRKKAGIHRLKERNYGHIRLR
jgi:membrane-associated phospholipid phosphatase